MLSSKGKALTTLTVTLPLPPRACWQNHRGHWSKGSRAKRQQRDTAKLHALAALNRAEPKWQKATVLFEFYWPDKRRRDPLNAMAAMKAAVDGLVDAGVLADDDQLMPETPAFAVDKKNPRVVVTVRKG